MLPHSLVSALIYQRSCVTTTVVTPRQSHTVLSDGLTVQVDAIKHTLAKYLMELSIVDYDMAHYRPSEVAGAALCLSMKVLSASPWVSSLTF